MDIERQLYFLIGGNYFLQAWRQSYIATLQGHIHATAEQAFEP
jgi:hypothetical protein